ARVAVMPSALGSTDMNPRNPVALSLAMLNATEAVHSLWLSPRGLLDDPAYCPSQNAAVTLRPTQYFYISG
ncbi:MAG: hypothetical protein ABI047_09905, partial [Jatrophihabitantaceae bacterium]